MHDVLREGLDRRHAGIAPELGVLDGPAAQAHAVGPEKLGQGRVAQHAVVLQPAEGTVALRCGWRGGMYLQ